MFKFNFSEAAEQEEVGPALCEAEQPQGCTAKEVPASEVRWWDNVALHATNSI